jgi:hypothetical protein
MTQPQPIQLDDPSVRFLHGPTILLASGKYFDFTDPREDAFEPSDLILGISREARYANQTTPIYMVAEHSVHVSIKVEIETGSWQLAWDALWHDSPEGILRDIVRPMKMLLDDYKALEKRVEPVIFRRLGVNYPLDPIVKHWDMQAQLCEKAQIEPHKSRWERGNVEPDIFFEVKGLEWREAGQLFTDRMNELVFRKAA